MEASNYRQIKQPINSKLYAVQNKEYQWGVVNEKDNVIVPYGKYAWIDGFQNGLAKVVGTTDTTDAPNKWKALHLDGKEHPAIEAQGIVNEQGDEVLPLEYTVWKFYGKDFPTIKCFKAGVERKFRFEELNPSTSNNDEDEDFGGSWGSYDDGPDYDELARDTWYAMTDRMYGDMPEGFDGDYDFLGY